MSLLHLGEMLRTQRGSRKVREIATEIGISPATLTRVEAGRQPDIETFQKICTWLKINPAELLDVPAADVTGLGQELATPAASVHFRADREITASTAGDLANLILAAQRELARLVRQRRHNVSPRI
jgi:transcriptional regulator with XRE-family HTH domain